MPSKPLVIFCCALLNFIFCSRAAQADTTLTIKGIKFNCQDCLNNGDLSCEIPVEGVRKKIWCDEAIEILLQTNEPTALNASELMNYLTSERVSDEKASRILQILTQTEANQLVLITRVKKIVELYEQLLPEALFRAPLLSQGLLRALWPEIQSGNSEYRIKLRNLIIAHDSEYREQDLRALLDPSDHVKTLEVLRAIRQTVSADSALSPSVHNLINSAIECESILSADLFPKNCSCKNFYQQRNIFSAFLQKFQSELIAIRLESKSLNSLQSLTWIAHSCFLETQNEKLTEKIGTVLQQVSSLSDLSSLENDATVHDFVKSISRRYPEQTAAFYSALADYSFRSNNTEAFDRYLKLSYRYYSGEIDQRNRFLERSQLTADGRGLSSNTYGMPSEPVLMLCAMCLFLFLSALVSLRRYQEMQLDLDKVNFGLNREERARLKIIFSKFGLAIDADEEALGRRFQKLASAHAKDVRNDNESFLYEDLMDDYNEAKRLVAKRIKPLD
ncbi:hypothetical protein JNK13_08340 [bacterium]|nr:hypothetical protein [bacterium]